MGFIGEYITPLLTLAKRYSFAPFWCLCQKLSLSPLYFNKTLLHKSSEWSSLVSGPGLNSSPPEAKNPTSYRSTTTFHYDPSSVRSSFWDAVKPGPKCSNRFQSTRGGHFGPCCWESATSTFRAPWLIEERQDICKTRPCSDVHP